mgnify:CR=1 FL=1
MNFKLNHLQDVGIPVTNLSVSENFITIWDLKM